MTPQQFETAVMAEGFAQPVPVHREVGYALQEHDHPFDARALITDGEITLIVDGRARTYRPGDIFDLPAGTAHHESVGPQGVRYLSGRRERTS